MFAKTLFILFIWTTITVSAASAQTLQSQPGAISVRESDSLLNGALIGAGAGVASQLMICRAMEPWSVCLNDVGSMLKFGALGAGVGMGIDALIRKKIYQSASGATQIHAAPLIGTRTQGLRLAVSF
jgi:hypothetical protein